MESKDCADFIKEMSFVNLASRKGTNGEEFT